MRAAKLLSKRPISFSTTSSNMAFFFYHHTKFDKDWMEHRNAESMPHNTFDAVILLCSEISQHVAFWCGASSGGWKVVVQFWTCPILCGWKARTAYQRRVERGWLTLRRSNKNGRLFNSNVFFFCLPLLRKVRTKCYSSEEKQSSSLSEL